MGRVPLGFESVSMVYTLLDQIWGPSGCSAWASDVF